MDLKKHVRGKEQIIDSTVYQSSINFLWIIVLVFERYPEKKLYFMWFVQYILCHVLVSKIVLYCFFATVVVVDGDRTRKYSCIVMLISCNIFMFEVWKKS
jgi:hypothetical protein